MCFVIIAILAVVILATVFRVQWARRVLELGRDLVIIYFVAIIILTILWTARTGF